MIKKDIGYYRLLAQRYPSIPSAATEAINLKAILNLPKGTEHFISDIHGEYEAFAHILKSASGIIKDKLNEIFPEASEEERSLLATLIYYPREKLDYLNGRKLLNPESYHSILSALIEVARVTSSKYTRSKVRKLISPAFLYVIEELLQSRPDTVNKEMYYREIIDSIIETGQAHDFAVEMATLIQKTTVDHLHVLGDIYDRGQGAFRTMELLTSLRSVDIEWGNHDIVYLGAAAGSKACVASVIRTCCRYNSLSTIEDGYGISLRPLLSFALKAYGDDDCEAFLPEGAVDPEDQETKAVAKMHKAITVILLKLEGQLIERHPNYEADYLHKLKRIDWKTTAYRAHGRLYPLRDSKFFTIDPADPDRLTDEEAGLIERLTSSFSHCTSLQKHMSFLLSHGSMYLCSNANLLFHGVIPTEADGSFSLYEDEEGHRYSGKSFLDYCDTLVRLGFYAHKDNPRKQDGLDFFYFLWCMAKSPLYGKDDCTVFERYFLFPDDFRDFTEKKNSYYDCNSDPHYCAMVLKEFGIDDPRGAIINGHMPVRVKKGESPIKAGGRLFVIDGGISKAYQKVTGLAGYTLVNNSYGFKLIAHDVFESKEQAIVENRDIVHSVTIIDPNATRKLIKETDNGRRIQEQVDDLLVLLDLYRTGVIKAA